MAEPVRLNEFDKDEWRDVARRFGLIGEAFEKAWAGAKAASRARTAN